MSERWCAAMAHEILFFDEETSYSLLSFVVGDNAE